MAAEVWVEVPVLGAGLIGADGSSVPVVERWRMRVDQIPEWMRDYPTTPVEEGAPCGG